MPVPSRRDDRSFLRGAPYLFGLESRALSSLFGTDPSFLTLTQSGSWRTGLLSSGPRGTRLLCQRVSVSLPLLLVSDRWVSGRRMDVDSWAQFSKGLCRFLVR